MRWQTLGGSDCYKGVAVMIQPLFQYTADRLICSTVVLITARLHPNFTQT